MACNMKSLLEGSEPANAPSTYKGPPIGWRTKIILGDLQPNGLMVTTTYERVAGGKHEVFYFNTPCTGKKCFACEQGLPHAKPSASTRIPSERSSGSDTSDSSTPPTSVGSEDGGVVIEVESEGDEKKVDVAKLEAEAAKEST